MALILVVDDRAVNREFLAMLLAYAGHRVIEAADGGVALEMLGQEHPDLIISDIVMPTLDGVALARCVRADPKNAHIPIIFYTASYRTGDAYTLADSCGVSSVITKPSKPGVILDAVATALGRRTAPEAKRPPLLRSSPGARPDLDLSLRLSMLIELGLELAAQRDPQKLLDQACLAGRDIFGAQYAAAGIVDQETGRPSRFAAHGFADGAGACFAALDAREGILGAVLREGKPRRLQDMAGNAAGASLPEGGPPIDSLLLVPLKSSMRSFGWFGLANRPGGDSFNAVDEQLAMTLASKLALAYDNLNLYEIVQNYALRLDAHSDSINQLNAGLKRQANARQISEARFRLAMEVGTTIAYTMDRELRYTWVHSSRPDFDESSRLGKTPFDLFAEETAGMLTVLYRQVIATGAGLRRDVAVRFLAEPLKPRDFELIIEPLRNAGGAVTGIMCAALDISERKQGEEELKAARADAERANNAKSRFLAAASHDLRQPLSALSIYVKLLRNHVAATALPMLTNMSDCVANLSALLNDLLDLSKLEAGVVTPQLRDFPVAAELASLVSVHTPAAAQKQLRLRFVPSSVTVHTDPVLFARIAGNLIDNAIRFTENGGVLVGCRRRLGKTWLEVWDSGIGIPEGKMTEIFEEFKRLNDDARNSGSGLGLAIVAKTAALLGLELRVRSWPGRGSMFALELPPAQGQLIPALARRQVLHRSLRIALVEDDARVREALVHALRDAGHQVVAAITGEELQAELGTLPPDIVISDFRLTRGETGFDVISALRAAMGADLPAILITGDTDPTLMRSMAGRGILVLHKPLDLEALQAHLEDLTCQAKA